VFNISSVEFCCTYKAAVLVCFAMETEVARVKRACVLSQNQIREFKMDLDSISRTIIKMELTEQMTDCGNYETYLKL
jgi:hypothetical protein